MVEQMRLLIKDKAELFGLYEAESQKLVTESPEDVEQITAAISARDDLIQKMNAIDAKMEDCRLRSEAGTRAYEIMKNRCDYSSLNQEERRLFDESQAVFTVMDRIRELDRQAEVCMANIMLTLKEKIRQNTAGNRFTGYLKQMDQSASGGRYDQKR